ncbi:MAG: autotransporter outer membrane beta-barrel domain-containing protein [Granulosicoccus sp.]
MRRLVHKTGGFALKKYRNHTLTLAMVIAAHLLNIDNALADCPRIALPDNSNLDPLRPFNADLETIAGASAAGLRALEFGTNFQRRSANLIGLNPLIVASAENNEQSGGAASDDDGLASSLGVLLTGFGGSGTEKSRSLGTDVDWDTSAATIAIDYSLSPQIIVGAMYGSSNVSGCSTPQDDFTTAGSVNVISSDVEGSFDVVSVYGIYESDNFYIDSIVSFGTGDFDFQRVQTVNGLRDENDFILLERVNEVIVAETSSDLFRASIAAGLKKRYGRFELSPYSRLSIAQVNIDGYREELDIGNSLGHPAPGSGGGFALRLTEQDVESLTTGVGISSTFVMSSAFAVISFQGDLEWVHEFNDTSNSLRESLAGFSQGTVSSAATAQRFPERQLDTDYFYLGVGATAVLQSGLQLYSVVQSLLDYQDVSETYFGAGIRYEF